MDAIIVEVAPAKLASVLVTYLQFRGSDAQDAWEVILRTVARLTQNRDDLKAYEAAKQLLLHLAQSEQLPKSLKASDALTGVLIELVNSALQEGPAPAPNGDVSIISKLLDHRSA